MLLSAHSAQDAPPQKVIQPHLSWVWRRLMNPGVLGVRIQDCVGGWGVTTQGSS